MNPPVHIREFQFPGDYEAVSRLWSGIAAGVRVGRSDTPQEIEKKLKRDPDLFLIAEAAGRVVGTVIGGFDGRRGVIYHLAVAAPHRKQGIGMRLMEEVESRLRARGCLRCYLMVTVDNEYAGSFYEEQGWGRMDYVHLYGKDLA